MKSVERLKTEHDLIERGLSLLDRAVGTHRRRTSPSLKVSRRGQPGSSSSLPTSATTPRKRTFSFRF